MTWQVVSIPRGPLKVQIILSVIGKGEYLTQTS